MQRLHHQDNAICKADCLQSRSRRKLLQPFNNIRLFAKPRSVVQQDVPIPGPHLRKYGIAIRGESVRATREIAHQKWPILTDKPLTEAAVADARVVAAHVTTMAEVPTFGRPTMARRSGLFSASSAAVSASAEMFSA